MMTPSEFFQLAQETLSLPPWRGLIRTFEVIAALVIILCSVGIVIFRRKRQRLTDEFRIKPPQ